MNVKEAQQQLEFSAQQIFDNFDVDNQIYSAIQNIQSDIEIKLEDEEDLCKLRDAALILGFTSYINHSDNNKVFISWE